MKIVLSPSLKIAAVIVLLLAFFLSGSALAADRWQIVTQVTIPQNAANSVAVNEALNKIYVSGGASGGQVVTVVDGVTFGVNMIGTGSGANVDPATNRYWAGGVYDGQAHVYNGSTDASVTTVSLGYYPISAFVDPVKRYAWVAAQGGGGSGDPVWAINADTYAVVNGPIWTGGVMGSLIANSATGRAYIGPSSVSKRIDPDTFAVTTNSFGVVLAVNPKTNRLYAGSGKNLQVINGAPDPEEIHCTIPLAFTPGGTGINTRQNRVFIANGAGNCLQFLDGKTDALGGIVFLGAGVSPYAVAVDSTRSRIYALASTPGGVVLYVIQDQTCIISTAAINMLLLD